MNGILGNYVPRPETKELFISSTVAQLWNSLFYMQFAARFMFQAALLLHAAHDAKLYT
jgi:hypothetical protein